jgi:probable phosphoglycerate mutase
MIDVQARVAGEMIRLAGEYPSDEIALVSHGDPIRAVLCHFLGIPLDLFHRIEIGVGSISVITLGQHGSLVTSMNFIPPPHGDQ